MKSEINTRLNRIEQRIENIEPIDIELRAVEPAWQVMGIDFDFYFSLVAKFSIKKTGAGWPVFNLQTGEILA